MHIKTFTITNKLGFHARPAAELVKTVASFKSEINLIFNGKKSDTRSLIAILSSGIVGGSTFDVQANGEDEIEAMLAISELINRLGGEH